MRAIILLILGLMASQAYGNHDCGDGDWYSERYERCFRLDYACNQYNNLDDETCRNTTDNRSCKWDDKYQICSPRLDGDPGEHDPQPACPHGYWQSQLNGKCYAKRGQCSQYNGTSKLTCNSGQDYMQCDWDRQANECYAASEGAERLGCTSDEWYSSKYTQCFSKSSSCSQYNGKDRATCNSKNDNLSCDWNWRNRTCSPE